MKGRHSRVSKLKEGVSEEDVPDFIRQPPTANHRPLLGPTSTPRTGSLHPSNQTISEEVRDNDGSDDDEGLFRSLLSYSSIDGLTASSGGVAVRSHPVKTSTEAVHAPPARRAASSSSSSGQLVHTMTPKEVEGWAQTHNWVFLQSLSVSMAAHNLAADPQTPAIHRPMIASTLRTPSPDSPMAASPGPPYFISTGHRSTQTSLTTPDPSPASGQNPQSALTPTPHPFRPNNMVLERIGLPLIPPPQGLTGSNYLGRRHTPLNAREVEGLLDFENCALFLTKIPVKVTLLELFSVITTGAVFCLHINPASGIHTTMAAKLAFMTPEAAAAFLRQIQSPRGVILHGQRVQGRYNRNGYVRNENIWQSRVLEVVGPTHMMTLEYWTSHFSKFSEFELEAYRLAPTNVGGVSFMQFRFARIDGQAQTCLQCIRTDPSLFGIVQARYGADPCGSSTAS